MKPSEDIGLVGPLKLPKAAGTPIEQDRYRTLNRVEADIIISVDKENGLKLNFR